MQKLKLYPNKFANSNKPSIFVKLKATKHNKTKQQNGIF